MKPECCSELDRLHSHRHTDPSAEDITRCARALMQTGHTQIRGSASLQDGFGKIMSLYPQVGYDTKLEFSFPEQTDGFLPFGMERSNSTNRVDLCERYCYRHKFRCEHSTQPFSHSDLYRTFAACEEELAELSQRLIDAVATECGVSVRIPLRDSSYLQYCSYDRCYRCTDREYLQDRHDDGNLITLAMASSPGLVLFPRGQVVSLAPAGNEVVVFTGALLNVLSDGDIPPMEHAVQNLRSDVPRSSLVYFALPDLSLTYQSFRKGTAVSLAGLANRLHQSFGNIAFDDAGSRMTFS
ncbi:MAG: 2OG-Fe(II) oxygenase family protein [Planctomycetaceae bacterium]|nr:2OG-Fe(II) oxygenase family protein [Planctomycetaceae bacterium]